MYPKELNYTMPAEWEKHERTFISWPVQASMVFPDNYKSVSEGYAEIIKAIAEFEPVTVIVNPEELEAVEVFNFGANVTLLPVRHNDAWLRDNGPTFVAAEDGKLAGVNWKFNAWGGKYMPWDLDDAVAPQILESLQVERFDAPLVMEGGSIHTDGEGTLITTEECLLHTNRNPELSRSEIEEYVRQYTGTESVIWLKRGLSGDETDGHVDNIACFAAPGKVIIQVCDDKDDENYEITRENLRILENAVDAKGRKLEIIRIQQPPRVDYEDSRLTLSYLNFYFVNGGIILPVFGGTAAETDKLAEQQLAALFPDRRIRTVNGMAVIGEGGNVHCTTQQMPARK
ncbi:agmatine deiminase family protein [Paenibacillus typhae]|uniref:agmatine deiminase family protein n=1 Tax=Paenibacillus typhae TaxID=1174501 RepID=UPI001C8EB188|nr:agmatine deiminase family protein [Paenibacillus typhae]MBY0013836.1 agmatine deiminase family protein [Paenibacillus typhae]